MLVNHFYSISKVGKPVACGALTDIRGTRHEHLMLPVTLSYGIPKYRTRDKGKLTINTTKKFLI